MDVIRPTRLLTWTPTRPIHQLTLDMEHVFLARMLEATARVIPKADWRYLMVDGLGIQPRPALKRALEAELAKHRYPNGEGLFSVKEPETQVQRQTLENTTAPPTAG